MNPNLLAGQLVRLAAQNPEIDPEIIARWSRDTEYERLLAVHPVRALSRREPKEWLERELNWRSMHFAIRTLADDRMIGFISLFGINHAHGDTWVGIGIGERAYWGQGYGTDAMKILLRFAFDELNLHRVSLMALLDNTRAVRSYEKCGFVREGIQQQSDRREGKRQDIVFMGCLRDEWRMTIG